MIPTAIIYEHEGKLVSVYTIRGSFEGILEVRNSGLLMVLKQDDQWNNERYGSTYVDTTSVIAIKEIKPRPKKDKDYDSEDDCCEQDSPKARFKKVPEKEDSKQPAESESKTLTLTQVESMYKNMVDEDRGH